MSFKYQEVTAEQAQQQLEATGRIEANGRSISEDEGVLWGTNEYGVDTFMARMDVASSPFERAATWISQPVDPYYD